MGGRYPLGFVIPNGDGFVIHGEAGEVTDGGVDERGSGYEAVLFVAAPGEPAFEVQVFDERDGGFVGGVVGDEDECKPEAWAAEVLRFEGRVEDELRLGGGFGVWCLFRHVYSPDSIMRSRGLISGGWDGGGEMGSGGECAGCGHFESVVICVGAFFTSGPEGSE